MTRRLLARALFVLVAVTLVAIGLVTGIREFPLVPGRFSEAAFSMLTFGAFVVGSGALFGLRVRRHRRTGSPSFDGTVTAIVPTYEDAAVLERSVESLLAAEGDVEVKIVPEPDDPIDVAMARRFADHDAVECLVNGNEGSKAGAINDAVERADGDVFAVFDADQEVPADFFERVAGELAEADVVQARFLPRPSGLVGSLTYYEYVLFNYCFRQPLYLGSEFRMATSKALVFTREAFETVGGYDPAVVAEDTDFGHRCYLAGLDVDLSYVPVVREAPVRSLRDWWGQRKRWMTGNVQVLVRLLGGLVDDARSPRRYVSLAVAASSVGGAVFLLSLVPKFLWLLATGAYAVAAVPLVAIYGVAGLARAADEEPMDGHWLLAPAVLPLFALVTLMAVTDYVAGVDDGWYAVEKGE